MKTIRKVEDFDEFIKIYRWDHHYYYFGNKPITPEKRQELANKDDIACFKRYSIYMFEDGYYFIVDTKTHIDSVIYYDDETPCPTVSEEFFIHYNIRNFNFDFDEWQKERNDLATIGCCSGRVELKPFINRNYSDDSKEVYLVFWQYGGNSRRDHTTIRDLTTDEIEDILEISKQEKENYIERLRKYYKKYNKNIRTHGYWANR